MAGCAADAVDGEPDCLDYSKKTTHKSAITVLSKDVGRLPGEPVRFTLIPDILHVQFRIDQISISDEMEQLLAINREQFTIRRLKQESTHISEKGMRFRPLWVSCCMEFLFFLVYILRIQTKGIHTLTATRAEVHCPSAMNSRISGPRIPIDRR